jgi:hypothetical protein
MQIVVYVEIHVLRGASWLALNRVWGDVLDVAAIASKKRRSTLPPKRLLFAIISSNACKQ